MRAVAIWAVFVAGWALSGCVRTQTAMLDQRTAIISGKGGLGRTMAEIQQKELVEAAKACKAAGYRYFGVMDARNTSQAGTVFIPGQTYTNGTVTGFGNMATYQQTTTTMPGQAIPYITPGQDMTVRFLKDGDFTPGQQGVWDAESVLAVNPDH
jgi:hypothetical protein